MKRSAERGEALQYLVEAVLDRSDVRSAAVLVEPQTDKHAHKHAHGHERAHVVAGAGSPRDLEGLARIAGKVARGEACADLDSVTGDADVLTCAIPVGGVTYYLAALGSRVRKMTDAARALARIVETTQA